ncbi:MAG: hypothetical protein QUS11_09360 [Candidatus Fermentibacter sp.]|nr:hypothetical protein [Candidatus Fermentibacter sp.]
METRIKVSNRWGAGFVGAPVLPTEVRVEWGKAVATYDPRLGVADVEYESLWALCADHLLDPDGVIEELVVTRARQSAVEYVGQYHTAFCPSESTFDSTAWGVAVVHLGLHDNRLWPLFQRTLAEETERLAAERSPAA